MSFTPEQIAFVQAHHGQMGDTNMGRAIGLTKRQVRHIRVSLGLAGSCKHNPARTGWTDDLREQVRRLTEDVGLSAYAIAEQLGIGRDAVRNLIRSNGWTKLKLEPATPSKAPKPRTSQADADLVAAFFAHRKVTVCPPGYAAGLTALEGQLGTAPPPGRTIRQVNEAAFAFARAKKATAR